MEIMDKQAHIFAVQAWSVGMILDDFEGDEWRLRPNGMSHALWVLGHVVMERKALGNILGMNEEITDRDRLFDPETKPDDVPEDLDGGALLAEFQTVHGRFLEHLGQMNEDDLAMATEEEFPATPRTRLGALQFLLMHESYHIGQLGALRVMAGKGSWLGKAQKVQPRE
jgi:DinB superfamily